MAVYGAALPISGSDRTGDGCRTRPALGVPTSWLKGARQGSPSSGLVVSVRSGSDPNRYVMVDGPALPISGAEWTANGYETARRWAFQPLPDSLTCDSSSKQPLAGSRIPLTPRPNIPTGRLDGRADSAPCAVPEAVSNDRPAATGRAGR